MAASQPGLLGGVARAAQAVPFKGGIAVLNHNVMLTLYGVFEGNTMLETRVQFVRLADDGSVVTSRMLNMIVDLH